ncbi:hypothetical protein [Thermococcus sp.]
MIVLVAFSAGCIGGEESTETRTSDIEKSILSHSIPQEETMKTDQPDDGNTTLVITDALGRTVNLNIPVRRAIVLPSTILEVVYILEAEEYVVGISMAAKQNELLLKSLKEKPVIARGVNIENWEKVLALNPDIIINIHYSGMLDPEAFAEKAWNRENTGFVHQRRESGRCC